MSIQLEQPDLELLDAIQQEIPLVERPFAAIGEKLGMDEFDVIERLNGLKSGDRKVIRQMVGPDFLSSPSRNC